MFSKVRVKNFKSIKGLEFNLLGRKNQPKKLSLIYGDNGSGKSSIVSVFQALSELLRTTEMAHHKDEFLIHNGLQDDVLQNPQYKNNMMIEILSRINYDCKGIIDETKMLASVENMVMEFEFLIDDKIGLYALEFDNEQIVSERLSYRLNKNNGLYFELTASEKKLNTSIFMDDDYRNQLEEMLDKSWGNHTFLSILFSDAQKRNEGFYTGKISDNLDKVLSFLNGFSCHLKTAKNDGKGRGVSNEGFLFDLEEGHVSFEKYLEIQKTERVLNEVFTAFYKNIKNVYYKTNKVEDGFTYELYFTKKVGDNLLGIPSKFESTGIRKILDLISWLLKAVSGGVVIIDEFDEGIHELLSKELILSVAESIKGQLILTTHNTILLESGIDKNYLYFLEVDDGTSELLCLHDCERRTQRTHNVRSLYVKGLYSGIPVTRNLDFNFLIDILTK